MATHKIRVDGFKIGEMTLDKSVNEEQIKSLQKDIAKGYAVPTHYIEIVPVKRGNHGNKI